MRSKITQSLPLLGTLFALMLGGALLFTFTPVDAVLDAEPVEPLPTEAKPLTEEELAADAEPTVQPSERMMETGVMPIDDDDDSDETTAEIDHMYAIANDVVTLDGHYLNDVYAAGNTIHLTGTINGDLFAAGNEIIIDGDVFGSVRIAGSRIELNGQVGRNVVAFAETIQIQSSSHIGQDLMINAAQADVNAMVMGNFTGNGGRLEIDAPITGDVIIGGVNELVFGDEAYISGNVSYHSEQTAQLDTGATIIGNVHFSPLESKDHVDALTSALKPIWFMLKLLFVVITWLGYVVLGMVAVKILPTVSEQVVTQMRQKPLASFGYGILVLVCGPIVLLILCCTIIGISLSMVAGAIWCLLMIAAKLLVGLYVGRLLLPRSKSSVVPFALGFSLVYLTFGIIGSFGIVAFITTKFFFALAMIWAFGAIMVTWKQHSSN